MTGLSEFAGQTVVVAVTIVVSLIALVLFFRWLPSFGARAIKVRVQTLGELFDDKAAYDVVLSSGQRLAGLQFEGLVRAEGETGWTLLQMIQMRRADGGKVLLRLDSVRVFEQVSPR